MEANRQNHLAPNNKGLWRAVTKYFMSTSTTGGGTLAQSVAAQQGAPPFYTPTSYGTYTPSNPWASSPLPVVEIREEKYAVFYRDRADKPTRNNVQGIILRDEETGAEIKMTLEELAVAAGMKW